MEKYIYIFFCLFVMPVNSQVENKVYRTIKLIEPQNIYLNGGSRSFVGGNSRVGFQINLPSNTVEWFYAITTEQNKSNDNIMLDDQLQLLLKSASITANLLSLVKVPEGKGLIDIYLTDFEGYKLFFDKDALGFWKYIAPSHNIEASRKSIKDGKIRVTGLKTGTHFLVLRNTSSSVGIYVKLEVIAIVEETIIDYSKWDKNTKETLYNNLVNDLKMSYPNFNNYQIEEISDCVLSHFINKYSFDDAKHLANFEIKSIFKDLINLCNKKN